MSSSGSVKNPEFVELYSGAARRIYSFILTLVSSESDADDVFQEASKVLWQKFDQYVPGTNFYSWACRIAHYQALYWRQRQQKWRVQFDPEFFEAVARRQSRTRICWSCSIALDACLEKLAANAPTSVAAVRRRPDNQARGRTGRHVIDGRLQGHQSGSAHLTGMRRADTASRGVVVSLSAAQLDRLHASACAARRLPAGRRPGVLAVAGGGRSRTRRLFVRTMHFRPVCCGRPESGLAPVDVPAPGEMHRPANRSDCGRAVGAATGLRPAPVADDRLFDVGARSVDRLVVVSQGAGIDSGRGLAGIFCRHGGFDRLDPSQLD